MSVFDGAIPCGLGDLAEALAKRGERLDYAEGVIVATGPLPLWALAIIDDHQYELRLVWLAQLTGRKPRLCDRCDRLGFVKPGQSVACRSKLSSGGDCVFHDDHGRPTDPGRLTVVLDIALTPPPKDVRRRRELLDAAARAFLSRPKEHR